MPLKKIALLLTSFSLLGLSGCGEKRVVTALPIPPERMDCAFAAERPEMPPELTIDWSQITTVLAAQEAHKSFVARVRTREGVVAGYLLNIEGQLFACSNDATWLREWSTAVAGS